MPPTLASGAKRGGIDFRKSLLETFVINEKANQLLLSHVADAVGYPIANDPHHRGQIVVLSRQVGHPVPTQTGFGLCEWGNLWRECGSGK
jgi:uncharacterized damage-inducible protein DinB